MHDQATGAGAADTLREKAPVSHALASFALQTRRQEIPTHVQALAALQVQDAMGVMLAGTADEATRIVREHVTAVGGHGAATLVGTHVRTHPAAAALVNGTSAHAHDFDDTQIPASPGHVNGLLTHPTAPIWAATMAVAEQADASGADALAAYLVGLEVTCRLCDAVSAFHYVRGFHSTQTLTVFGAAAAAARLLGLSVPQTCCAFGLAASMAAGLRINFGTMAKPFHAGRAAESGVLAAQLALRGMTARPNALEDPGGFFKTFASDLRPDDPALVRNPLWGYLEGGSPGFEADRILGRLGQPWYLESPGVSIKPFPSVVLSHPSMLALRDLVLAHDIEPARIARIVVRAGPTVRQLMYLRPETGLQGKFSLVYCLALVALRRPASLADFTDEVVRRPEVRQMMDRIELRAQDGEGTGPGTMSSEIEVVLDDGSALRQKSGPYKGGPDHPLSPAELDGKFLQCAGSVMAPDRAAAALAWVKRLPQLQRVAELTAALAD